MRSFLIGFCGFCAGFIFAAVALYSTLDDAPPRAEAATPSAESRAAAAPAEPARPVQSPEERVREIAQSVAVETLLEMKRNMRDPSSARFRNLYAVNVGTTERPMPVVCGEVNARNAFGGYTGFIQFYAAGSFVKTAQMDGFNSLFAENCIQHPSIMPINF
jgi:hypothetical protein